MKRAVIWSRYNCPNCEQAKALLDASDITYEEKKVGDGYTKEDLLDAVPNAKSVPQIFLDGEYVGGLTELKQILQRTN